jgi:hypothetical protein
MRSEKKLMTLSITAGAMIITFPVTGGIVMAAFGGHPGMSEHDRGYVAGVLAVPVSMIAGILTALVYSARTKAVAPSKVGS